MANRRKRGKSGYRDRMGGGAPTPSAPTARSKGTFLHAKNGRIATGGKTQLNRQTPQTKARLQELLSAAGDDP